MLNTDGTAVIDLKGNPKHSKPNVWLDKNRPVEQMAWAPGEPLTVNGRLLVEGGWIERDGVATFNLYRPPTIRPGNAANAGRWVELVKKVYPDNSEHIITFLAQRVQYPAIKINHALLLGGCPGIGKDTILEPARYAVGPWNCKEVSPQDIMGNYNDYMSSIILRISEAHDLGDVSRYSFHEHTKTLTASPPETVRVNGKYIPQHYILNVTAVIYTTNHRYDSIFLPANDRRHYVAWSELLAADFEGGFWVSMWNWYRDGGINDVVAYLKEYDLSNFDPKAPPEKTEAFWQIVGTSVSPEDAELADALDALGRRIQG